MLFKEGVRIPLSNELIYVLLNEHNSANFSWLNFFSNLYFFKFLEKISTFRTNINAGFANVGKGANNYKFVYPDQYIY